MYGFKMSLFVLVVVLFAISSRNIIDHHLRGHARDACRVWMHEIYTGKLCNLILGIA